VNYDNFETLPGAYAFRLYRNYDGSGSKFGDVSVSAASGDQSQLAIYAAQRSSDSALTLVIINKTGGTLTGDVSLAGFTPAGNTAQVFRYSAANLNAIVQQANQPVTPSSFSASFPANSMTLVVIPGASAFNSGVYLPVVSKSSAISCPG
ncbi:MAG: endoglucanase, partial [Anaerolineales bacterium]|nr:endoglucanase [Anaerolineales bacterium]